mgnify:CR=1 FL=1|jgi:ribonuclease P protein component
MQTLKKKERLCNVTAISRLFRDGRSIFRHPVKLLWLPYEWEGDEAVQLLVTVPKRNFKKAVDRNRIKRLMREIFRKNKEIIIRDSDSKKFLIGLVFTGKEIPGYTSLEPIIISLLQRLIQDHEKTPG